ncbi:hypothetical protein LEP1GSC038_4393 [Leptospira weilii str. 2006001855]|uniref:Uncharacterized protein n=1 Tax=Leptospira weilii str. 2006001855 TaxID=996804 RepID=M6FTW5_9LEPT|nr:hypothetical protein LEP1GSC038_4393 [Leptospira weilii str. 2006001855]
MTDSNANFGKAFRATLGAKKRFRGTGCSEAKVRRLGAKSSRDARLRVTKFFSKKSLKHKLTTRIRVYSKKIHLVELSNVHLEVVLKS